MFDQSDLADQTDDNYTYTNIGELLSDTQEEIETIDWKVTGKVLRITRNPGSTKSDLVFTYDAMGNRIIKAEYSNNGTLLKKTYYFRDAQGNCMSIYTIIQAKVAEGEPDALNLVLIERNIYGSSRVGLETVNRVIASTDPSNINIDPTQHQLIGDKSYELSNHLGNVLEVITDRKVTISDDFIVVDYYSADVDVYNDYYPFGMLLPNRHGSSGDYRYGFNGMEKDDEVKGANNSYDFGARIYDPRVGRWLSSDPLEAKYPNISSYCFAVNSPIIVVDYDGRDVIVVIDGKSYNINRSSIEQLPDGDLKTSLNHVLSTPMGQEVIGNFAQGGEASDYADIYITLVDIPDEKNANGITKVYKFGDIEGKPTDKSEEFTGDHANLFNKAFESVIKTNNKMIIGIVLDESNFSNNIKGQADVDDGLWGEFLPAQTTIHELLHAMYKIVDFLGDEHETMGWNPENGTILEGSPLHQFTQELRTSISNQINELEKDPNSSIEEINNLKSERDAIDAYLNENVVKKSDNGGGN